jgi:hypothetical protein
MIIQQLEDWSLLNNMFIGWKDVKALQFWTYLQY